MVKQLRNGSIDLNSILMIVNFIITVLIVFAFNRIQGNEYINQETIVLAVILSIQTHVALFIERRQRDPFVILLAFTMILYFSLRIFTLTLYPISEVFDRYPYNAENSNDAIIFIVIANTFLFAGFYVVKFKTSPIIDASNWRSTSTARVIFLMLFAIVFIYTSGNGVLPRMLNFLVLLVSQDIIFLMALVYYFTFKDTLSRKFVATLIALILFEAILHILSGSRSAIIGIIMNITFAILAVAGSIKFNKKYVLIGLVLMPVFVALLTASFILSTTIRASKEIKTSQNSFNLMEAIDYASATNVEMDNFEPLLAPIFSRVGFYDYSAEIIAHSGRYSSVLNFESYGKSIIDNLLTPGFDVFDQPKISNSLNFIYRGLGKPSKNLVGEGYQSDQLGIYGEFYALFGYASIAPFFLMAFLLKRIYVGLRSANPYILAMKRIILLYLFDVSINSFGFDWLLIQAAPFVASIYIYRFFFPSRLYSKSSVGHAVI